MLRLGKESTTVLTFYWLEPRHMTTPVFKEGWERQLCAQEGRKRCRYWWALAISVLYPGTTGTPFQKCGGVREGSKKGSEKMYMI